LAQPRQSYVYVQSAFCSLLEASVKKGIEPRLSPKSSKQCPTNVSAKMFSENGSDSSPQERPIGPQIAGFENSSRSDDSGNQLRRRDIEPGISARAGEVGHPDIGSFSPLLTAARDIRFRDNAPRSEHFALVPFFDGDVRATTEVPIEGRKREGDVERDPVSVGQDGQACGHCPR
jgi:hypothetical protein